MRHYLIQIDGGDSYDSAPGGVPDPNALQVDIDITVNSADTSPTSAVVRIWGVGIQKISQAGQLYGKTISVSGGMAAGLPLAKPQQFGLLSKGVIQQAYGEWEGVNQSLTIVFVPVGVPNSSTGPNQMPPKVNLTFNALKGTPAAPAIQQALQSAYPGIKVNLGALQNIIFNENQVGFYPSLQKFAYYLRRITQQTVGGNYWGVSIDATQGSLNIWDSGTGNTTIVQEDLVGFPVWIEPRKIQVKTIMRGDLRQASNITLPQTWVNTAQGGAPQGSYFNQQGLFSGTWTIFSIRHVGSSRAPSGDAWVSIFECTAQPSSSDKSNNTQGGQ